MMVKSRVFILSSMQEVHFFKILVKNEILVNEPLLSFKAKEVVLKNCQENSCFEIVSTREVPQLDFPLEELIENKLLKIRYFVNFETWEFTRIISSELNLSELSDGSSEDFLKAKCN